MKIFDHLNSMTFTQLYQQILKELIENPQYIIKPRGMPVRELMNATVLVMPKECTIDFSKTKAPERQEAYDRYRKAELEWYLSGNTLASSAPSKFWNQLADGDGHITSNYGHMMLFDKVYPQTKPAIREVSTTEGNVVGLQEFFRPDNYQTAIDRVVDTLTKDPDSRQAITHYSQPRHCFPQNKDFPCTVYSQFFLRNGELNMTTYQRSCDIIKGFSYDVPWSCHFMEMVLERLKSAGSEVHLGEFTHVFGSLHLYEKDLELAKRIVEPA